MKGLLVCALTLFFLTSVTGCWYVAAAGAGAYGGYKAKESGYSLQSPVTKEGAKKSEKKEAE